MIKIEELRCGNWFVKEGESSFTRFEWRHLKDFDNKNFNPIPITEEWLLNAGFKDTGMTNETHLKKDNFHWYSSMGRIIVEFDSTVSGSYDLDTDCRHVHKLQNLYFALKGEEL